MKARYLIVAATSLLVGSAAFADTQCTDTPQSSWMSQADMLRQLADTGYTIERFQVTRGDCYKMHGWDRDGKRVEMSFDPVDGRVVKMEAKMDAAMTKK
jgi:hypothetical protein